MWARGIVLGSDSMNALDKASRRDYASRVRHRASINTPFVALLQLGYRPLVIRNERLDWSSITPAQL